MSSLSGRTVLVVGATGVLGSGIAVRLAEAGARVLGTASSLESLPRVPTSVTDRFACNLRDERSIDELVVEVGRNTSTLDGIVFASGAVAFGSVGETPLSVVNDLVAINFAGPIRVVVSLIPLLEEGTDPFVLTLSGKIAEIPTAGLAAYSASKGALFAYARAAARDLRRSGIRWIDARPGHAETGLASRAVFGTAPDFGAGLSPAAVVERLMLAIESDEKDLPSEAFT